MAIRQDTSTEMMRPPEPPGPLRWMRDNLFNNWYNGLLTIVSALFVGWLLVAIVRWIFTVADWRPVVEYPLLFMVGQYPRDLIWRQTHLLVQDGPEGEVYVPAIYANAGEQKTDQLRLGRMTEWVGGEGTPVLGMGQRTFLVGEEAKPIMEIETLSFEAQ